MQTLPKLVAEASIGQNTEVVVWRNESKITLYVNLGKQPSLEELAVIENEGTSVQIKELGIKVRTLSDDDKIRLELDQSVKGVIIADIDQDSFLIRQNIKKDDVIIEIQNKPVTTSGDALTVIDEVIAQGKENILIVFYAGPNSRKYIGVRLSLN